MTSVYILCTSNLSTKRCITSPGTNHIVKVMSLILDRHVQLLLTGQNKNIFAIDIGFIINRYTYTSSTLYTFLYVFDYALIIIENI